MKLFRGFAVAVVILCFCSASQSQESQNLYKDEELERITISMDDDLLDRSLRIKPNVKYTIRMESSTRSDYKLSVTVVQADCMDLYTQVLFNSVSKKDGEEKKGRFSWTCIDTTSSENSMRIYDSSTSSLEITTPDSEIEVKFLITAYFEINADGQCPMDFYTLCGECDSIDIDDDDYFSRELDITASKRKRKRCISSDLKCNGRNNCANCDSNDEGSCNSQVPHEECFSGFHDTQYMLTILLAGLFFIMSPIVIVLVLFYHKRMNPSARQREILRTHQSHNGSSEPFTISTSSSSQLRNDRPPTYEDLHDTKTSPPNYDDVIIIETTNEVTPTNADSNIPQGSSNNV